MTLSGLQNWIRRVAPGSLSSYAIAIGLVAVATLIEWCLQVVAEGVTPFDIFFPVVFFATLIGGAGPGTFAVCLSFVIGWWAFLPPRMSFQLLGLSEQISLLLYPSAAVLVVWGVEHYCRHRGSPSLENQNRDHP